MIPVCETFFHPKAYYENRILVIFMMIMSSSIGITMFFFNAWNWYLALKGHTTISFMQERRDKGKKEFTKDEQTFMDRLQDSIYKTFGTKSLCMVLVPSKRKLPFRGLEWSFDVLDLDPECSIEISHALKTQESAEDSFELLKRAEDSDVQMRQNSSQSTNSSAQSAEDELELAEINIKGSAEE